MHPALLKLTLMLVKGWFRRQFSGGSLRRTIFGALGIGLFLLWFSSIAIGSMFQKRLDPADTLAYLPVILTTFAFIPVLFGTEDRAIAFSPAEIDFLFPGPFTRRDLVLSKVLRLTLGSLGGGIFFGLFLRRFAGSLPLSMFGAALSLIFVNLLTTALALLRGLIEERLYKAVRITLLFLVLAAGALLVSHFAGVIQPLVPTSPADAPDALKQLLSSTPARIVLAPARVFAHIFAAQSLAELAGWSLAALGLIALAAGAVRTLDSGYMSAALAASERRQAKLARLGKGSIATGRPARALAIPALHALGPYGAIVKRQCITAVRTSRAWMVIFLVALGYSYLMSRMVNHDSSPAAGVLGLLPGVIMLCMMLPQMIRFDFRGDLDHIENLKSLPVSPLAAAAAELTVPTLILSAQGAVILGGMAVFVGLSPSIFAMAALALVPITLVLIGLENFVFLLVPTRVYAPGQAGAVFSGRRLLYVIARLGLLIVGGGLVAILGLGARALTTAVWPTFLAAWFGLALIAAGAIPATAWAFARFNVSADMPA